ncbi:hypothetical protein PESP_a0119 [Pseudoalteromonas espejiana DSM 9414]|uniref:DUF2914 domain-containing protein n=1 Tax=Pseudoalteromonas espejiana TaxID=28107 RepID=A0A510XXX0_9GAMM|nr:DUF2914 domain-containing protein [Pseudoalteromonas espejiana]ASM48402.1 hypothetical protein PESP_a0119 [Pseudoalteromonas espejiana DSM 9414]GEK55852.1 hypothetical protein PES01_26970 [Pseudoalteromonas espejiana]
MSQKIVIKANVKREPQNSVPNVSYEWHWRRIASVSMLVAMTSAAVVYGLTTSVNAEQGEHPNEQEQYLSFADNNIQNNDALISDPVINEAPNDEAVNSNEQVSESELARTALLTELPQATDDAPLNNAPLSTNTAPTESIEAIDNNSAEVINNQQSNVASEQVNEQPSNQPLNASPSELLAEIQSDDGVLTSSEGFSANAHIASVALGAQIDTSKISRAVLTRKVSKREPTNVFAADIRLNQFEEALSFFSELKNLQGQQVKHVWSFEGETMAEISLNVTSPRYRTYSTKNIMDTQTGHWRVDVVDEQGNLIAQKEFRILAD